MALIGTNLISYLLKNENNIDILNIDIKPPKIKSHEVMWKYIDICDEKTLFQVICVYSPDYVIRLAARTDLSGNKLYDYNINIDEVFNLLDVLEQLPNLKRVIFTSSMYVCKLGYMPPKFNDYAPHTLYGESKAETEKK
jgi:nucleoside-diphosphate-sugar epimerase